MPITFFGLMHTSEDHYLRPAVATTERLVRILAMMITVLMPGLYHRLGHLSSRGLADGVYDLYPDASQDGRAAGGIRNRADHHPIRAGARSFDSRAGRNQPAALGIVGGIVLGEALVMSNIVSPVVLIVIALTVLSSLPFPITACRWRYISCALRFWRWALWQGSSALRRAGRS